MCHLLWTLIYCHIAARFPIGDNPVVAELYPDMQGIVERNCNYLIYVAEISIAPEFRCMGLGVSNSMVALKAFPLVFKQGSSSGADK